MPSRRTRPQPCKQKVHPHSVACLSQAHRILRPLLLHIEALLHLPRVLLLLGLSRFLCPPGWMWGQGPLRPLRRHLVCRQRQVWLLPHNEAFEPIDGTHATILGIVTAVLRKV